MLESDGGIYFCIYPVYASNFTLSEPAGSNSGVAQVGETNIWQYSLCLAVSGTGTYPSARSAGQSSKPNYFYGFCNSPLLESVFEITILTHLMALALTTLVVFGIA